MVNQPNFDSDYRPILPNLPECVTNADRDNDGVDGEEEDD
jgi:hypothetical protein